MTRVVIDLEATCWQADRQKQQRESEIIEIGAVYTDDAYQPIGEFQTFVKPVRNPLLTAFCTSLTTITQAMVDKAVAFKDAMAKFLEITKDTTGQDLSSLIFCSWGNYDRTQFEKDCLYHKIAYPFGIHVNLKDEFAKARAWKPCGVGKATARVGIAFSGTPHRAISDARQITKLAALTWGQA